jgi:glycine C-acetyltransferase
MINERERDLVSSSTKTRALFTFYQWLSNTNHINMLSRIFKGNITNNVKSLCLNGITNEKNLIHLGSYNYSGLNNHKEIISAAEIALKKYGTTTSGVRLLNGTTDLHIELENRLANFLGFEDVVTYSSGYAANFSVLSALCSDKDIVFSDELNHQSIVDGLKLSGTYTVKYPHRDSKALEGLLKGVTKKQRKFIVTDGIFSMDGDVARLDELVYLANKYDTFLIVDDAHATASFGPNGKGTPAHFKLEKEVDVLTGSLSKGLPGIGGFAAGSKLTTNLLRFGSNGYIFSASLPPSTVAGLITAIDILEANPKIQNKLHENETYLRNGIISLGLNVMHSETPIIPILLENRDITFVFARKLHEKGVYVNPICFPAVSRYLPRIRINVSAELSLADMDYSLNAIESVASELKINKVICQS